MRHFKLVNNAGQIFDITTKEALFYEISGLGFEEDNAFSRIGSVWWLSNTQYKQVPVKGKMLFTEENGADPYETFQKFVQFISRPPITLLYNPFGPVKSVLCNDEEDEENAYYRTVRVSKLEKSELTELGVLDENIEFTPYTPWYRKQYEAIDATPPDDGSADTGWIWGDGGSNPPLTFEPASSQTATRARFRWEPPKFLTFSAMASDNSPAILTIHGPVINPRWIHTLVLDNGLRTQVLSTGSFTKDIELSLGDKIIIDSTPAAYSITLYHANGTTSDLYPYRDFEETCFINLKPGVNRISVMSSDGDPCSNVEVEGFIYHATV